MLDGKRYFAEFPDEDPARRAFLHSPKVIATLRALEKELRPYISRSLECALKVHGGGFFAKAKSRDGLITQNPYRALPWTNFRHKLRNVGQVFAPNHETKRLCIEIALKQGWGKHTLEPKKNWAFEQGNGTMIGRHWLDYDHVALAVLIIGLGIVELVAFGI
jgi:hypothetical protein